MNIPVVSPNLGRLHDQTARGGVLILNADDWGRDRANTDRILECVKRGTISAVSAMVFMEDSERAASIARERAIDAGLHLNFTSPFTFPDCPPRLLEHQTKVRHYLARHRLAKTVFHPGLRQSFEYVVSAQLEEYRRLHGADPERLDGHHHMHLCANVLWGNLMPEGTVVRRNFTFRSGEKSFVNRFYRNVEDRILARRHRIVDFFFNLSPLEPEERLTRIFSLAQEHAIEVETHPVDPKEHRFLMGDGIFRLTGNLLIAPRFALPRPGASDGSLTLAS